MSKGKKIRTKGKIRLSKYFQQFEPGEKVAVIKELSEKDSTPKRIHGRTGTVKGKQGEAYIIEIKEINKSKKFLVHPIHLKKIK